MPTIYIAGPDLFFRDTWPAHCARVTALCEPLGLTPIFPVPATPITGPGITSEAEPTAARPIYESCLQTLRECDAVLANLTPFRGQEPDAGTVWEAATAKALGKIVVAYVDLRSGGVEPGESYRIASDGAWVGMNRAILERFGLPVNLMLACGVDLLLTEADDLDPLAYAIRSLGAMVAAREALSEDLIGRAMSSEDVIREATTNALLMLRTRHYRHPIEGAINWSNLQCVAAEPSRAGWRVTVARADPVNPVLHQALVDQMGAWGYADIEVVTEW